MSGRTPALGAGPWALPLGLLFVSLAASAGAQQNAGVAVRLTGSVADSTTGQLLAGALVVLDSAVVARTDSLGEFVLEGARPGAHLISVSQLGYQPRVYAVTLAQRSGAAVDIGALWLAPLPQPTGTVTAQVRDTVTGQPVAAAELYLNGTRLGLTGADGVLGAAGVRFVWGTNTLVVRRLLYDPLVVSFRVLDAQPNLELEIALVPLPTMLPEVVVEGDRTVFHYGHLAGFYRRQRRGEGIFLTAEQIEARQAGVISEVLKWVPDIDVIQQATGNPIIAPRSRSFLCRQMEVFIDGQRVTSMPIDQLVLPSRVAGIEIYTRASQVPPEFSVTGTASCGAVVIWTKD